MIGWKEPIPPKKSSFQPIRIKGGRKGPVRHYYDCKINGVFSADWLEGTYPYSVISSWNVSTFLLFLFTFFNSTAISLFSSLFHYATSPLYNTNKNSFAQHSSGLDG